MTRGERIGFGRAARRSESIPRDGKVDGIARFRDRGQQRDIASLFGVVMGRILLVISVFGVFFRVFFILCVGHLSVDDTTLIRPIKGGA